MASITAEDVFGPPTPVPSPSLSPSPVSGGGGNRQVVESMGPLMKIVCWALVAVSGLFLVLRLYCKFLKHRGLWWDDHVLVMAWLALVADAAVNTVNLSLGFGMHTSDIDPMNLPGIGLLSNLSSSLAILGAVWSKTSFGMTLLRITENGTKAAVWFIIVTMNLAMTISVLVTWIQCNPIPKGWEKSISGVCWDPKVNAYYGVFAAVYSGLMDVVLALLPWTVIWGLQMRRKEKVGIALAMSMGVFAGCAAFVKSTKIPLVLDGDFTYEGYDLVIWGAAEVAITICAASVPLLRVLIREVRNRTTQRRYGYHQAASATDDTSHKQHQQQQQTADSFPAGPGNLHRSSTVVITAEPVPSQWKLELNPVSDIFVMDDDDDDDEKTMGNGNNNNPKRSSSGRILQTHEVRVQYHDRQPGGMV